MSFCTPFVSTSFSPLAPFPRISIFDSLHNQEKSAKSISTGLEFVFINLQGLKFKIKTITVISVFFSFASKFEHVYRINVVSVIESNTRKVVKIEKTIKKEKMEKDDTDLIMFIQNNINWNAPPPCIATSCINSRRDSS